MANDTSALYQTLAEMRTRLGIKTVTDTADDTRITSMITAVSAALRELTGQTFHTTAADETRYYTPEFSDVLEVGPLVSVTTLATDEDGDRTYERTWAATDYDLEPANAALDSKPYREIWIAPNGNYAFPVGIRRGVKVIGKFGWGTTPEPIKEAVALAVEKLFRRKDAIFGVVGGGGLGELKQMMRDDPELKLLIAPYMTYTVRAF